MTESMTIPPGNNSSTGYQTSALPTMEYRRSGKPRNTAPSSTPNPQYLTPPRSCYLCEGDHFNGDCTAPHT